MQPMNSDVLAQLRRFRIVPIITIDDARQALSLADALAEGGLSCLEVTFRTPAAAEALRRIAGERPSLLIGAGTVLTPEQAALAKDAGARFILSPGLNRRVVAWCQEHALPIFPGVCTPTDIEMALEQGLKVVKVFPAEQIGGLSYLKAIAAPFPGLEFMPTGGINASNLNDYLAYDRVVACGGSWMAPQNWISAGAFDKIRDTARQAADAAHGVAAKS
jgi:2-dehydro-3-deoxyphosphogluconate aldolase/(4S)-4-hydroxy-2-oxoglutarate aldolase